MDHFATNPVVAGEIQDAAGYKWYPIQELLNNYNNRVQALPARPGFVPNRFKFVKSAGMTSLENGTHANALGHNWDAYFRCNGADNRWCDVQVNYQIGLRTLYDNLDN